LKVELVSKKEPEVDDFENSSWKSLEKLGYSL
jgi:hypothetical protein